MCLLATAGMLASTRAWIGGNMLLVSCLGFSAIPFSELIGIFFFKNIPRHTVSYRYDDRRRRRDDRYHLHQKSGESRLSLRTKRFIEADILGVARSNIPCFCIYNC